MEKEMACFPTLQNAKHFYSGPDTNKAKKPLNLVRSKLMFIKTGFNSLSYVQFKANPEINPMCRLCHESNETYWHLVTECPRVETYRQEVFLDQPPIQVLCVLRQ